MLTLHLLFFNTLALLLAGRAAAADEIDDRYIICLEDDITEAEQKQCIQNLEKVQIDVIKSYRTGPKRNLIVSGSEVNIKKAGKVCKIISIVKDEILKIDQLEPGCVKVAAKQGWGLQRLLTEYPSMRNMSELLYTYTIGPYRGKQFY